MHRDSSDSAGSGDGSNPVFEASSPIAPPLLTAFPGLDQQVKLLLRRIEIPLREPWRYRRLGLGLPKGIILHGPPGSGKTFLARSVISTLDIHSESVSGADLVYGGRGESEANLRSMFGRASRNAPSIVVVDEIDAVVASRAKLGAQADYRLVAQFLTLLDGLQATEGVIVLGTTNLLERIDPALRRPGRFDLEVAVTAPVTREREEILHWYFGPMPLSAEARDYVPLLAEHTWGYLPADLMALCREAGLLALDRELDTGVSGGSILASDLHAAEKRIQPSLLRGIATVDSPAVAMADVQISPQRRMAIEEALALANAHNEPLRLLVVGPEEVGRSIAEAVAGNFGQRLLLATPIAFVSSWFGETEGNIRDFFGIVRTVSPVTVCLLHLDGLSSGVDRGDSGLQRATGQLIDEMYQESRGMNVVATVSSDASIDARLGSMFTVV